MVPKMAVHNKSTTGSGHDFLTQVIIINGGLMEAITIGKSADHIPVVSFSEIIRYVSVL